MDLIFKLFFSPWFWVDIILSITGGIIVFWGLTIEKKAEKYFLPENFEPDLFADIIESNKKELERGWRILMIGIAFEVIAAFGISVISGMEITDLNAKTTSLSYKVEELRRVNDALEAKMQPRIITPKQKEELIGRLSLCATKGKVFIWAGAFDGEATQYAAQIDEILSGAGFEVIRPLFPSGDAPIAIQQPGLHLVVRDLKHPPKYAGPIQECFTDCGITMEGEMGDTDFDTNRVVISVGQHI